MTPPPPGVSGSSAAGKSENTHDSYLRQPKVTGGTSASTPPAKTNLLALDVRSWEIAYQCSQEEEESRGRYQHATTFLPQ